MSDIPSISDYVPAHKILEGEKIKIDAILNLQLKFTGWIFGKSYFEGKERLTLQFELDGEKRILFTSSQVLIDQVRSFIDKCNSDSFTGTIKKLGRCYKFI